MTTKMYLWQVEFLWDEQDAPIEACRSGKPHFVVARSLDEVRTVMPLIFGEAKIKAEITSIVRMYPVTVVHA